MEGRFRQTVTCDTFQPCCPPDSSEAASTTSTSIRCVSTTPARVRQRQKRRRQKAEGGKGYFPLLLSAFSFSAFCLCSLLFALLFSGFWIWGDIVRFESLLCHLSKHWSQLSRRRACYAAYSAPARGPRREQSLRPADWLDNVYSLHACLVPGRRGD